MKYVLPVAPYWLTTNEMLYWPRAAADADAVDADAAAAGYVLSNADTWRLNSGPKKMAQSSALHANSSDLAYRSTDASMSEQIGPA